jgi:PD-(D/E)XK nuclease superfamily protein
MRLGWKLPVERLSATSLALSIQCPEQFRQKYIVREKEDVMFGARFMGIVDHKVNEELMRYTMKLLPEERTSALAPGMIETTYRQVWNDTIDKEGEPDWRDDDPAKMIKTGVKMATAYHQAAYVKPIALEQRFDVKIPGVPVPVVGYIDVLERDRVRERKTTGVKTTKPKSKWRFQGFIYQYAAEVPVQWDVVTRQVTPQVFLADAWPDLWLPLQSRKVTEQMIRDAAYRINSLYAQYGADETWPMTGMLGDWLCDYCVIGPKYKGGCPAWQS